MVLVRAPRAGLPSRRATPPVTQVRTRLIVAAWLTLSAQLAGGPAALVALDCLSADPQEIANCCHGTHAGAACPLQQHAPHPTPGTGPHSHDEQPGIRSEPGTVQDDEHGGGCKVGHQCRPEVSILQNLLGPLAVLAPSAEPVLLPPAPGVVASAVHLPDDIILSPPFQPPRA